MAWLRDIINEQDCYFTAVDPADFYEWKITGIIPKGTILSKRLPDSNIFSQGFIIASANIKFEDQEGDYIELKQDIQSEVQFKAGAVLSPTELLNKFSRLKKDFQDELKTFRNNSLSQAYLINPFDNHVYRVTESDDKAEIHKYELFSEIQKKLTLARRSLEKMALIKKGRSYELEQLRRFETIYVLLNQKTILDKEKVDYIFHIANIEPIEKYTKSWQDYFINISDEAKSKFDRISIIDSLTWVRDYRKMISSKDLNK